MGWKLDQTSVAQYARAIRSMPRETFNATIIITALFFAQGAVPVTWDQGMASTVPNLAGFRNFFHISSATNAKAIRNFVSLVYIGDGVGAALSYFFNDRLGRLWSFRAYVCVYIIGQLIAIFAPNVAALYASRIITGIGIGSLSATAPMTIAELAPPEIRGLMTAWYTVSMAVALLVANFCVYGSNIHIAPSRLQYQVVFCAPAIYLGVLALASFFYISESPRWLLMRGRQDEALVALTRLRGLPASHPRVEAEFAGMKENVFYSHADGEMRFRDIVRETFTVPENLRRVQQALILFALPQLSGANAVTSYLVPILKIVGAEGNAARNIFLSGMYALAKLFFALLASFVFIDMLGRRKTLFIGIVFQMCTDIYIGAYVQYKQSHGDVGTAATRTALAAIYMHGFAYAIGLFPLPYVFGGELWPNKIRSFCAAMSQCWHWLFHYAMTSAAPSILDSMDNWGAFIFYAAWCAIALVYVYFVVPETASLSLEALDEVFRGSWFNAHKRLRQAHDVENSKGEDSLLHKE